MHAVTITVPARKRIALVAHDRMKPQLVAWSVARRELLAPHDLFATGTTGTLVEAALARPLTKFLSGPLGGDQQLGAAIAEGRIDVLIFFWDPLAAQPHEPDVRALLRLATVRAVPTAATPTEADFLVTSPMMAAEYDKLVPAAGERVASGGG